MAVDQDAGASGGGLIAIGAGAVLALVLSPRRFVAVPDWACAAPVAPKVLRVWMHTNGQLNHDYC